MAICKLWINHCCSVEVHYTWVVWKNLWFYNAAVVKLFKQWKAPGATVNVHEHYWSTHCGKVSKVYNHFSKTRSKQDHEQTYPKCLKGLSRQHRLSGCHKTWQMNRLWLSQKLGNFQEEIGWQVSLTKVGQTHTVLSCGLSVTTFLGSFASKKLLLNV